MDSPVSDFRRKLQFRSDSHWLRLQYLTGRTGPLQQIAGGVSYNDLWTEYYGQKKKRLEQAPSGLTEGKTENTDRDLELLWKARQ